MAYNAEFRPSAADSWSSILSDPEKLKEYTGQWTFSLPIVTFAQAAVSIKLKNVRSENWDFKRDEQGNIEYDADGNPKYIRTEVTFTASIAGATGQAVLDSTDKDGVHEISIAMNAPIPADTFDEIRISCSTKCSLPLQKGFQGRIGANQGLIFETHSYYQYTLPFCEIIWSISPSERQWSTADSSVNDGYTYVYYLGEECYVRPQVKDKYAWLIDLNINVGYPYLKDLPTERTTVKDKYAWLIDLNINVGYPYLKDLPTERTTVKDKYAWLIDLNKKINVGYPYFDVLPTKNIEAFISDIFIKTESGYVKCDVYLKTSDGYQLSNIYLFKVI